MGIYGFVIVFPAVLENGITVQIYVPDSVTEFRCADI